MNMYRTQVAKPALLAALCFCLAVSAGAGVTKRTVESFPTAPGAELFVDTDIGSIEIRTHANPTVEVEVNLEADTRNDEKAEKQFSEFEVEYEREGDDVLIYGEFIGSKGDWRFWKSRKISLNVEFIITVPSEFDLTLETSGGSIAVDDLQGEVRAKTSGGSLSFEQIDGPVWGRTSGGSIQVGGCDGSIDLKTSGGSISVGRVNGDVYARTSGGSITVDEVFGTIDVKTSGGGIRARISQQPRRDCRLVTSGGGVRVDFADDYDLTINAKTSGGRVRTEFPVKVSGDISESRLHADINNGGAELYIRTSGGNIILGRP